MRVVFYPTLIKQCPNHTNTEERGLSNFICNKFLLNKFKFQDHNVVAFCKNFYTVYTVPF